MENTLTTLVTLVTLASGIFALFQNYTKSNRSDLQADYERVKAERAEANKRCEELEQRCAALEKQGDELRGQLQATIRDYEALEMKYVAWQKAHPETPTEEKPNDPEAGD